MTARRIYWAAVTGGEMVLDDVADADRVLILRIFEELHMAAQGTMFLMTQKTADELRALGYPVDKINAEHGILIVPEAAAVPDAVLICNVINHGRLSLPDNASGPCESGLGCGNTIEWRPHAPAVTRLCARCAVAMAVVDAKEN